MNRRSMITSTAATIAASMLKVPLAEAIVTFPPPLSNMTAFNALNSEMMHISVVAPDRVTPVDLNLASQYYNALRTQMLVDKFDAQIKKMAGMVTVDQLMNHPVDLHYIYNHQKITHPTITYQQVQNTYASTLPKTRGDWAFALDQVRINGTTPAMSSMSHYYAGAATKPRTPGGYMIPLSFCNGGYDTAMGFLAIAGMTIFVMSTGGIGLLAGAGWLALANGIGYAGFGYGTARMLCA